MRAFASTNALLLVSLFTVSIAGCGPGTVTVQSDDGIKSQDLSADEDFLEDVYDAKGGTKGPPKSPTATPTPTPVPTSPPPTSSGYIVRGTLLVASDKAGDLSGIEAAKNNLNSAIRLASDWYRYRAGQSFTLDTNVRVIKDTSRTAQQWIDLSNITGVSSDHRYDYFYAVYNIVNPLVPSNEKTAASVYVGLSAVDVYLGAASAGRTAVIGPRSSTLACPAFSPSMVLDSRCADASYAIGHELGHTFGMHHSCDSFPSDPQGCNNSIMQARRPIAAILLSPEITHVRSDSRADPWFN